MRLARKGRGGLVGGLSVVSWCQIKLVDIYDVVD